MMIKINTDNNIEGREELVGKAEEMIGGTLERFSTRISRLEVHLGDENSHKSGGQDQRCMIEARVEGIPPIAVTHKADTMMEAITAAADRMKEALDSNLGRLHARKMDRARNAIPGTDVPGSGMPT